MLAVFATHYTWWPYVRSLLLLAAPETTNYALLVLLEDEGWINTRIYCRKCSAKQLIAQLPAAARSYTLAALYAGDRPQPPPLYGLYPSHAVTVHLLVGDEPIDIKGIRLASATPKTSKLPTPLLLAGYVKRHIDANIPLDRVAETLSSKGRQGCLGVIIASQNYGITPGSPTYPALYISSRKECRYTVASNGYVIAMLDREAYRKLESTLEKFNVRPLKETLAIIPAHGYPRAILAGRQRVQLH